MINSQLPQIFEDVTVEQLNSDTVSRYGEIKTILHIAEEMGELITAISQYSRKRVPLDKIIEETADVWIMLDHACFLFRIPNNLQEQIYTEQFDKFVGYIGVGYIPFVELCTLATKKYGEDKVILQTIEELSETMAAMSQYYRKRISKEALCEEIEGSRLILQHFMLLLNISQSTFQSVLHEKMRKWYRHTYEN